MNYSSLSNMQLSRLVVETFKGNIPNPEGGSVPISYQVHSLKTSIINATVMGHIAKICAISTIKLKEEHVWIACDNPVMTSAALNEMRILGNICEDPCRYRAIAEAYLKKYYKGKPPKSIDEILGGLETMGTLDVDNNELTVTLKLIPYNVLSQIDVSTIQAYLKDIGELQ